MCLKVSFSEWGYDECYGPLWHFNLSWTKIENYVDKLASLGQNNKESDILNLKVTPNIQTATDCTIFFHLCSEKASLSQVQQLHKEI